jgi:flagellar protein FliJ
MVSWIVYIFSHNLANGASVDLKKSPGAIFAKPGADARPGRNPGPRPGQDDTDMKPFVFKLEKVLGYRRQLEEAARLELARVLRQRDAQRSRIEIIEARIEEQEQNLQEAKTLTSAELWLWRTYRDCLAAELVDARIELIRLESEVVRCREQAVARSKERKLLEKLKSNQAVKYVREQNLAEQKEFDEMATLRYQPQAV